MEKVNPLLESYGARVEALVAAYDAGDERAFATALAALTRGDRPELLGELRELTASIHGALERFTIDARLVDLADKDIPDARQRLAHVLAMTEEAAHRTLDLVEKSGPPAERTAAAASALHGSWRKFRARRIALREFHDMLKGMDAFLPAARADAELVKRNLGEVLLTQGYQDLTGQIIRGVMQLIDQLEIALAELKRITGLEPGALVAAERAGGHGPVVPGVTRGPVAIGQKDVDELLSGLGM